MCTRWGVFWCFFWFLPRPTQLMFVLGRPLMCHLENKSHSSLALMRAFLFYLFQCEGKKVNPFTLQNGLKDGAEGLNGFMILPSATCFLWLFMQPLWPKKKPFRFDLKVCLERARLWITCEAHAAGRCSGVLPRNLLCRTHASRAAWPLQAPDTVRSALLKLAQLMVRPVKLREDGGVLR